jgi:hypothetical protein
MLVGVYIILRSTSVGLERVVGVPSTSLVSLCEQVCQCLSVSKCCSVMELTSRGRLPAEPLSITGIWCVSFGAAARDNQHNDVLHRAVSADSRWCAAGIVCPYSALCISYKL